MLPRERARKFFLTFMGRVPGASIGFALGDELTAAERRGEERILALLDPQTRVVIEQRLLEGARVSALDGVAQPAQDVTDECGATTPAGE